MVREYVPLRLKRQLRPVIHPFDNFWRRYLLRKELARLGESLHTRRFKRLAIGWANGGWTADPSFLRAVAEYSAREQGPILECGSGLSTLVAASFAEGPVWALEHLEDWADTVSTTALARGLDVRVLVTPLVDFGHYEWYRIPSTLPERFSLVICDGPPSTTKGGRYGLIPTLKERLKGATILLDDGHRQSERQAVRSWVDEFGVVIRDKRQPVILSCPS